MLGFARYGKALNLRGGQKKSGLASEPVTLDPEYLEQNGWVLRNLY